MDYLLLTQLLKQSSIAYNIPIYLYKDTERIESFEPFELSFDIVTPFISNLHFVDDLPRYFLSKDFILIGRIFDSENKVDIIIGPILGRAISNEYHGINNPILHSFPPHIMEQIYTYFRNSTYYPIERFLPILSIFHGNLNHEFLSFPELIKIELAESFQENTQLNIVNENLNEEYANTLHFRNHTIESQIMYIISRGQTEKLKDLQINQPYSADIGKGTIRYMKNALIILNSLCVRAAVLGGLTEQKSYQLGELYLKRIENCQDINSLLLINLDYKLLIDYCERVSEIQNQKVKDIKINKVVQYCNLHFKQKITVGDIANEVELTKEYLSSKFHKVMGKTLPNYINELKINESKYLLHFTDMSLIEISSSLSFSSQSYFQTLFKKYVGVTPLQYRADSNFYIHINK